MIQKAKLIPLKGGYYHLKIRILGLWFYVWTPSDDGMLPYQTYEYRKFKGAWHAREWLQQTYPDKWKLV